ncbi:MAG: hypothetical protein IKY04_01180, partial [Lachnospiraceae bacterium]|nr:hypothetical protein [Lachnospiraceae bacterium]
MSSITVTVAAMILICIAAAVSTFAYLKYIQKIPVANAIFEAVWIAYSSLGLMSFAHLMLHQRDNMIIYTDYPFMILCDAAIAAFAA